MKRGSNWYCVSIITIIIASRIFVSTTWTEKTFKMQLYDVRIYNIIIKNNHYSIISSFDHPIWLIYAINFEASNLFFFSNSSSNDSKGLSPWKRLKEKKVKKKLQLGLTNPKRSLPNNNIIVTINFGKPQPTNRHFKSCVFKENTKNNISKT